MEPSTANAADRRVTKASVGAPTIEEGDDIGASALHELSDMTTATTLQASDIINTVCLIVGQRWDVVM